MQRITEYKTNMECIFFFCKYLSLKKKRKKNDKLNNCLYKQYNRQASFSKISDVKLLAMPSVFQRAGEGGRQGGRVELWGEGEGEGGKGGCKG